jgi:hypothetical protein
LDDKDPSIPLGAGLSSSASCSASVFVLRAILDFILLLWRKSWLSQKFLERRRERSAEVPADRFLAEPHVLASTTLINDNLGHDIHEAMLSCSFILAVVFSSRFLPSEDMP